MSSLSLPASPRPSANQKPRPRADVLAQKHTDHVSHFRGNLGVKQASLRSAMKSSRTAQEGLSELDKLLASFGDDDSHKNEEGDNLQTRETDDSPVELRRSSGNRDTVVITFQSCPEHPGFLSFYQV
ncbi:hypothetical protein FVE85_2521 [Porphyridium purpureum]|uniref:Uncharacterized protein n=1 Tax=Porphyridium purpureum TaxID=35688 RepID=A0A5J4YJC7_PORPP|nr:hypothetical protein FVE85_2521 [Porphyridium purpureum]|eukprot:POR1544..scf291_13